MNKSIQKMKFKSRGGIIQAIIGLPCAGLGIAQIHSGITDRLGVEIVLILVGLFFLLLGIGIAFTRRGVVIDKRSGNVTEWYGLMIPMYKSTTPLSDYGKVRLTKKVIKGEKQSKTVYPVSLVGDDVKVHCEKPESYQRSRQVAEELAKFLGLGLSDSSSGEEVFRDVERLDESIRERADRTGEAILGWTEAPSWSSIQYKTLGQDTIIELPARKFNLGFLPVLFIMAILFWALLDEFDVSPEVATPIRLCLVSLVVVIFAVDFVPAWRQAAWGHRVTVSGKRLIVSRRKFFVPIEKAIPADELEEFHALTITGLVEAPQAIELMQRYQWAVGLLRMLGVFRGKLGVHARSDRVTCVFGSNLSDEEIQWLHDAVKSILVTSTR